MLHKDAKPGDVHGLIHLLVDLVQEELGFWSRINIATFETTLYEATAFAPNPTDGTITIYPSKSLIGSRFSILDNPGRSMVSGVILDYTIDLSDFPPGIYTLKIEGEKTMKIIKQ